MSAESQAIFQDAWSAYEKAVAVNPAADTSALIAAANGHLGASRPLSILLDEYHKAMEDEVAEPTQARRLSTQALADEMCPVRMADAVAAGNLPFRAPSVSTGG